MAKRGHMVTAAMAAALVSAVLLAFVTAGAGPAGAAFPGENGRIAFVRDNKIWTMNPDGTAQTNLTGSHGTFSDWDPPVSPDGTKIAFMSYRDARSDNDYRSEIYVMDAAGSNVRRLTFNAEEAIYVGSAVDREPSWFPDGKRLVFVSGRHYVPGEYPESNYVPEIFSMAADGSDVRRLTRNAEYESYPAVSPDGTKIAYESDGEIWVMGADGSDPTNVTADDPHAVGDHSWSPDGKLLFAGRPPEGGGRGWFTMNPNGSGRAALLPADGTYFDADFSPDGEKLVVKKFDYPPYHCYADCPPYYVPDEGIEDPPSDAYTVNADGTGLRRLEGGSPFEGIWLDWGPRPASAPQEDAADPTITRTRPAPDSEIGDRTPTIKAVVRDETDDLTKADITLRVDGRAKRFSYDPQTDRLSRTTNKLSYGRHTVEVEATDGAGNEQPERWSFRVVKRG